MSFDVAGEVAGALRNPSAAWRFAEGFAAAWADPLEAEDGFGRADLDAAEERLGVRLPDAVRDAYALFGKRPDLTSNQDRLLMPSELRLDGDVLVFRAEIHAVTSWGVRLGDADPEVVTRNQASWTHWLPTFSTACVEMLLSEALFAGDDTVDRELDPGTVAGLEARYTRLAIPRTGLGTRWFAGPDVILRDDYGDWLWARTRSQSARDTLFDALPGVWRTD